MSVRHAIILVGGRGTRLQPLTDTRPKPILPIVGEPFLSYQLAHLRDHGIEEVTFACGFMPQEIIASFGDGAGAGMRLHYMIEPVPLGTGGAIAFAAAAIDPQALLVCNGDILTDLDLGEMIRMHQTRGAQASIALTPVDDPSRYGLVRIADDGQVLAFVEKPEPGEIDTNLVNAGTYVLESEVVASIAPDKPCSVERDVFPTLVGNGLYAAASDAYWNDIGTFASYRRANADVLRGKILAPHQRFSGGVVIHPSAVVSDDATIEAPAWIGPGAQVRDGAVVGPDTAVGEATIVGDGARAVRSVLMERVQVGREAQVIDSVLGEGSVVESGCSVSDEAVVAPGETVRSAVVRGGTR